MFGFLIGTLSLIGFVKVWRHGHLGHRGGPRRWMLRRLYEHLDTTPGQEKVIAQAMENVERVTMQTREQFFRARSSYAKAMRGEQFDSAAVNEAFDAQQASVDEVKKALREAMQQIHEALTPEQRSRAADLIEFGPARMHGCGRHHFGHHPGRWGHGPGQPSAVNL
ncbi:MAG: Spy/CpxP family protein refolding chaperone [Myxococcota bacterium]